MTPVRRTFLQQACAFASAAVLPTAWAQTPATERRFAPQPGEWRTFEVTTRVDITRPQGQTQVWLPVPSVNSDYQRSLESSYSSNGQARMADNDQDGAKFLHASFAADVAQPFVEITSRIQTQSRAVDWRQGGRVKEDAATLAYYLRPTALLPTDGIVRQTALEATRGARSDEDKVRRLYDWLLANAHREPKVRGCGEGDIKTMLETGNLGGKCADLNALFVGLCRSVGVPARDVYGIRLAPSAFGYRELGGNPASLKGAQHCRAEVFLKAHGWVAMDPADVAKVMRQETPEWIKAVDHPLVAPVHRGLFGGWEGNWMAWNTAHDLALPGAAGPKLGFLMYPIAETGGERLDSYAPDDFKYQISAREIRA